jgi:flagellar biosynthesis protein FliQ
VVGDDLRDRADRRSPVVTVDLAGPLVAIGLLVSVFVYIVQALDQ